MLTGTAKLRSRVPRWPAIALLGSAIWMGTGCSLLGLSEPSVPEPSVPEISVPDQPGLEDLEKARSLERRQREADQARSSTTSEPGAPELADDRLVLGQRRQGALHCGEKRCNETYTLEVPKPGKLRLELRAPGGEGLPDLGVLLEDVRGQLVGTSIQPQERPRVIRKDVVPGTYHVRVYALGSNGGIASYDVLADLEKKRKRRTQRKRSSTRPPPPKFQIVASEVLEVERDGGEPAFVLIEAGKHVGIEVGLTGELIENGKPIAKIKVIEVFPDGSRVQILDRLSAPITIETQAQIRVPK
jgi:hypothetical protein